MLKLTEEKRNMLGIAALALCVLVASACWMMMRFSSMVAILDLRDTEYKNWVLHAYIVCYIAMIPIGGKLSDLFGPRKVLIAGAFFFLIFNFACTFANSFIYLSWLRGGMGFGAGLIIGAGFAAPGIIGKFFRGIPFGQELMAGAFAIGSLFGAATGYFFIDTFDDWKAMYWAALIIMSVGVCLGVTFLPKKKYDGRYVDVQGMVILALLFFTVAAMIQVVDVRFFQDNPWTLLGVVVALALGLALHYRRQLVEDSVLPRVLSKPVQAQIIALIMISLFVIGLLQVYFKAYLIHYDDFNLNFYKASILFVFLLAGACTTSMFFGHRVASKGAKQPMLIGCIFMLISLVATYLYLDSELYVMYAVMFVLGLGLGCVVTVIICSVQFNTPVEHRGAVTGVAVAGRMIGIIAGLASVTNYLAVRIDDYLSSILGEALSGKMDIIEMIMAIFAIFITTGEDVTDVVLNLYVSAFQDWSLYSISAVVVTTLLIYFFYEDNDIVSPEVEHAEDSTHKVETEPALQNENN